MTNQTIPDNSSKEPQQEIPLFRKEALEHKKGSYLGKSLIITPISFTIWTFSLFAIAVLLGLFLYFGKYAKRQDVPGILIPNKGLMQVYVKSAGIVADRFVQPGEKVIQGQLLYLISTEQHTMS